MSSTIRNSFYRNKRYRDAVLKAKLARKEKELKSTPIPKEFKDRITDHPSPWSVFYRQSDAFEFARGVSENVHVFSYESEMFTGQTGQRMYLATSFEKFWHYYRQLEQEKRHHYEVIPEGAACKLYFDLEFNREVNSSVCGENLVDIFIKYVCATLKEYLDTECHKDDVLILDATSATKFSEHLIFMFKNAAFHNNIEVGQFVNLVCANILNTVDILLGKQCDPCCPSDEKLIDDAAADSKPTLGLNECSCTVNTNKDRGEQSHNAQMPKKRKLEHEKENESDEQTGEHDNNQQTGVCHKCQNARLKKILKDADLSVEELSSLVLKNKEGKETLFCDTGVYTKNRNFRLYLSSKLNKRIPLVIAEANTYHPRCEKDTTIKQQLFLDSLVHNINYTDKMVILTVEGAKTESQSFAFGKTANSNKEESSVCGYSSSPYPEIDKFIHTVINKGGEQGYIRRFTYFPQGELLVFDIGRNRWCENIRRPHKSNNIIIVADLLKKVYYQKCHDPECKAVNFKSEERDLPMQVLPSSYFEEDFEASEDDLSDNDLLLAVNIDGNSFACSSPSKTGSIMLINNKQSREDYSASMEEAGWEIDDRTLIQSVEQMEAGS